MIICEYISQVFMDFGVRLSDAAVTGIVLRNNLTANDFVGAENINSVDVAIVKSIPMLLLTPSSVGEGGLSISKAQNESITSYYKMRCKELGIKDTLTKKPKVTFL